MSLATNIVRRSATYYFRVRTPRHLEAVVRSKELCMSLRTNVPSEARFRAAQLSVLTEKMWSSLERIMSLKNDMALGVDIALDHLRMIQNEKQRFQREARAILDGVTPPEVRRQAASVLDLDAMSVASSEHDTQAVQSVLCFTDAVEIAVPEIARAQSLKVKRVKDYRVAARCFTEWFGRDLDLTEITPELAASYKTDLTYYPANGAKRPQYRDLSFKDRIVKARDEGEGKVLDAGTINTKYLAPMRRIYEYHIKNGLKAKLPSNPFEGIAAEKRRKTDLSAKRREFNAREVNALLELPLFVGSKALSQRGLYQAGEKRVSDYRYWVPLIALFTGARLNEICALAVADFAEEDGIPYLVIREDGEGQSLKSQAAFRRVPLHKQLIELRFPEFVEKQRALGRTRLFEELELDADGYVSADASKFLNRLVDRIEQPGLMDVGELVFYSTRHTVIGQLRSNDVREDVSMEIVGHELDSVHSGYGSVKLSALKEAVDRIDYPGVDWDCIRLPDELLGLSSAVPAT